MAKLISDERMNYIRGKASVGHATPKELKEVFEHIDEMERKLDECTEEGEKAEAEALVQAFIRGAKWWEWIQTGATMWQGDQNMAAQAGAEYVETLRAGKDGE